MLQEIHIENYAVIDQLSVEFGPGLNLLSGETGSGKSILVDALGRRAYWTVSIMLVECVRPPPEGEVAVTVSA